jgi:hypothetical protein
MSRPSRVRRLIEAELNAARGDRSFEHQTVRRRSGGRHSETILLAKDYTRREHHAYLLVPVVYLGWVGIRGLAFYTRNWTDALTCADLATTPFALAALIARDVRSEIRSRKATYGRVRFKFSNDGIAGGEPEGFVFADEWARYAGFYVGRYVIVCPRIGSPMYLRIPIAGLVASQR